MKMEIMPEVRIERVPILTQSMITTIQKQGFTIGKDIFDLDTGTTSFNVYHFGQIKKRIIFDKDERNKN